RYQSISDFGSEFIPMALGRAVEQTLRIEKCQLVFVKRPKHVFGPSGKAGSLVRASLTPDVCHGLDKVVDEDGRVGRDARPKYIVSYGPVVSAQINGHNWNIFKHRLVPRNPVQNAVIQRTMRIEEENATFALAPGLNVLSNQVFEEFGFACSG